MLSYLSSLFASTNYIPHGICLLWQPELMALHAGSDAAIAIAYYSIPFAIIYFVWKRTDLVFPSVFMLSGAFILACGTTHIMSIVTLWQPDYQLEGVVKLVTAAVSLASAFAIWRVMPLALALPSTTQLEQANRSLAHEIAQREHAQAALRDINMQLEGRVAARTAELQGEVAQRKRGENALRRSEAYLAEAQRLSLTGSFGWTPSSGEIYWSEESYRIFELDQAVKPTVEFVLQRVHADDRALVSDVIREASCGEKDFDLTLRLVMPNGLVKYVHVLSHAMGDEAGNLEIAGALMDVTAAKRAEADLYQARTELARVSRVTTLGELTAAIAHEINQPLTGLVSSGNACLHWLVADPPDLEAARRSVERMIDDVTRAGEVIRRIRAMVKKSLPQRDSLRINDVIEEVIALVYTEFHRHSISPQFELSNDLPQVSADRVQLQQVVLNLIMNAIEAMNAIEPAQRRLLLRSLRDGPSGVLVAVIDSGTGLDEASADRLFDAFYTTKPDGMGIGLAVSQTIIQAHGGQLWASANVPRGAIFQFRLPAGGRQGS